MKAANTIPEPDRISGAPHPRDTLRLIGQSEAESFFLTAFNSNRLHHGWLINGPRGVGKATLAWSIARFLLATPLQTEGGLFGDVLPPPNTLNIAQDHPVHSRTRAGSEPGLFVLRRPYDEKTNRLKKQITVDEVRKLKNFFALSATDGGRRVVIVDAADDMNISAANAILKVLEEPPKRCCLLLISHQPAGLLPTLRSRCCDLRLLPLSPADMALALQQAETTSQADTEADFNKEPEIEMATASKSASQGHAAVLAELSAGSVGGSIRLSHLDGIALYRDLISLFSQLPNLDRSQAIRLADTAAMRGAEDRFDMLLNLLDIFLSRLARSGVTGQMPAVEIIKGEFDVLRKAAPNPASGRAWAESAQQITARVQHGRAVNLDPAALILDTVFRMQKTAAL
jgi:DNA polymerase-3 subunit delta'